MPRVQIPITDVSELPVNYPAETVGDPVNDHYLAANDGNVWMEVRNTDVGSRSFTIQTSAAFGPGPLAIKDPSYDVAAGATILVGPFYPRLYNQKAGADVGRVFIDVSGTFLRFRAFHLNARTRSPGRPVTPAGSRVAIPVTRIVNSEHVAQPVQPAYTAGDPANDHRLINNDGRMILEINNQDAVNPQDVVINSFGLGPSPNRSEGIRTVGGDVEVSDNLITVPASGHVICGGFDPLVYNGDNGIMDFNITSNQLQFRAYRLPPVTELV